MRFEVGDRVTFDVRTTRPVVAFHGRGQIIKVYPAGDLAAVEVYRIAPDDLGQSCLLAAEYEVSPIRGREA